MPETPRTETWPILVTSPDCMEAGTSGFTARRFLQGMMNRMGVSHHKYGPVKDNFPHRRTGALNAALRIDEYHRTGNIEFLIDAANYCLIEALEPSRDGAFFKATDSDESPGALNKDGSRSHGKED